MRKNLKDINKRFDTLNKASQSQGSAAASSATMVEATPKGGENVLAGRSGPEANMDTMHRQQWIMDLMNPRDHVGFGGDEMMLSFEDNNHDAL